MSVLGKRPMEILLVEDNDGDILLTRKALESSPLQSNMTVCKNGEDAVNFLFKRGNHEEATTPDLILLDWNLPRLNGAEVLREIKSDASLSLVPVIVLTTSESEEDILKSYQLHASSFIRKPVDFLEFDQAVQQLQQYWFHLVKLPR